MDNPNVVNQLVKFSFRHNGTSVEYSLKPTDDTNPFEVIELIDRISFAIAAIGAEVVSAGYPETPAKENQMFKAKCDNCGEMAIVPFKPNLNKPFYCGTCYAKRKLVKPDPNITRIL